MRQLPILLLSLMCASATSAKDDIRSIAGNNASAMHVCISSRGEEIKVWTDKSKQVVAVGPMDGKNDLPKYLAPVVVDGGTSNIQKANTGYRIQTQGPGYDREEVLMAGGMRFSCTENSDG